MDLGVALTCLLLHRAPGACCVEKVRNEVYIYVRTDARANDGPASFLRDHEEADITFVDFTCCTGYHYCAEQSTFLRDGAKRPGVGAVWVEGSEYPPEPSHPP